MGDDDLKREIKVAMREALEEERDKFWISDPEHYLDHKWMSDMRRGEEIIKKTGLILAVTAFLGFLGSAVVKAVIAAIRSAT